MKFSRAAANQVCLSQHDRFADEDIERQVSDLRAKLLKQNAAADTKKEYADTAVSTVRL
jgi:hypothetical protein